MDTKLQIPEKITRLLESKNIGDNIIGVELLYKMSGREGIVQELDAAHLSGRHKHPTDYGHMGTLIEYNDCTVWIGPAWIEHGRTRQEVMHNDNIINNKTK